MTTLIRCAFPAAEAIMRFRSLVIIIGRFVVRITVNGIGSDYGYIRQQ